MNLEARLRQKNLVQVVTVFTPASCNHFETPEIDRLAPGIESLAGLALDSNRTSNQQNSPLFTPILKINRPDTSTPLS